jgi:hypothetical protein
MASPATLSPARPESTVSRPGLHRLPLILTMLGGLGALLGVLVPGLQKQFAFSWLLAFMFYLSVMLGGMFLVMLHHLFDAKWSVPVRRIPEHLACLSPVMAALFLPILVNALLAGPEKALYGWMHSDPEHDHALKAKAALFNRGAWTVVSLLLLGIWIFLSRALRKASLEQDRTGAASCTRRMRAWSAGGIFVFALTLTLAAILWMKSLQWQWFSTMYGVYYFAGTAWLAAATLYGLTLLLQRQGALAGVVRAVTFHEIGTLFFAFTVFYAYIAFSQYFLVWNGAIPEETFWYVIRERGSWWDIGLLIVFGHFFLPFLLLLRIDTKLSLTVMIPLVAWAWLMHFCDLSFNIMPALHSSGFVLHWLDLACMAFMGGLLAMWFIRDFRAHPPFPQKDPRMAEALGYYVERADRPGGAH